MCQIQCIFYRSAWVEIPGLHPHRHTQDRPAPAPHCTSLSCGGRHSHHILTWKARTAHIAYQARRGPHLIIILCTVIKMRIANKRPGKRLSRQFDNNNCTFYGRILFLQFSGHVLLTSSRATMVGVCLLGGVVMVMMIVMMAVTRTAPIVWKVCNRYHGGWFRLV